MKSQRLFVIGIILIAFVSAGILLTRNMDSTANVRGDRVLVLRLYGGIQESGGGLLGMEGTITPQLVERQLRMAAASPSIQAVVLRVSSPGGSVAASQEIYSIIQRFDKPIVISMGDTAASGGYYIAAAADGIVANPGTITGSIGVITSMLNLQELYDKLGIQVEIIKSGRHKDMSQRPLTPEERELLQALNDEAWNQFVQAIVDGRDLDIDHVRNLATGEVFTGSQALQLGLVDRLGGIDEAVAFAGELAGLEDPVAYELPSPSVWRQFFNLSAEAVTLLRNRVVPNPLNRLESLEGIPTLRY